MTSRPPQPSLGATFSPGAATDDYEYYMPEVYSPTPQRVISEVPSNMQQGLATLELDGRPSPNQPPRAKSPYRDPHANARPGPSQPTSQAASPQHHDPASYAHTNASAYENRAPARKESLPKMTPFPKLVDPNPNVPLSDDEKEDVLERARPLVLQSTDPEMQLAWAQDALSWVEAAGQAYLRQTESGVESPRAATPKIEHQLRVDAINIVCFLADQQHPKAEFMKGMWLEFGKFGYRVDKKEAFLAYKRASQRGYARAEYRIGMQYESTNNPAKATEHYRKGVALGDSASNYRLGMMTLLGQHGMQQNYIHGIDLIRLAADTADENAPQGAYVYGMLLARELPNITIPEESLPYDLVEAKLFIEKAAYLGFAKAQLKMAQAYELCQLGCDFEPTLSLHYNALAARQGESEADMAISKWFLCGYEGVFDKNEKLAYEYARKAAAAKNATAEFAMGYFYEIGMAVPMNLEESERWYRLAEEHGNKDAVGRINSIKQNKSLSKADHEKVAISRIKSQHGSQRGVRPDRFRSKPSPMPAMVEDNPDVSRGRPVSQAPYPEEDVGPQHPLRTNSPYRTPGLRVQNGLLADRPSSAFGIRTPQGGQPLSDQRPASTVGNFAPPEQRPVSMVSNHPGANPRGSYSGQQRPLSAWDVPQQPQRQPSPGPPRPPKQRTTPNSGPANTSPYLSGAPSQHSHSQPQLQQYPAQHPQSAQQPYKNGYGPNKLGKADRHSSMGSNVSASPRTDTMPPPSRTPVTTRPLASSHSRQSSVSSPPQPHTQPGSIPKINEPVQAPPPRKQGPATFEEMGIPQAADKSECVVM